jgi:predicted NBD/HSP70 family sugar kinase
MRKVREEEALRTLLGAPGALTRAEIAAAAGLSANGLNPFLDKAIKAKVLVPAANGRRNGSGRPPKLLRVDPKQALVVAADLGTDHLRLRVADLMGEEIDVSHAFDAKADSHENGPFAEFDVKDDPNGAIAQLATWIDRAIDECARLGVPAEVAGIGIAFAGPVSPDRTDEEVQIRDDRGLSRWRSIHLKHNLRQYLSRDLPIHVDNDATLGLLAELRARAARSDPREMVRHNIIFIRWTTRIGAGLAIAGQPYRGSGNVAGEIAHVAVTTDAGVQRTCHRGCTRTCLESVAGGEALLHQYQTMKGAKGRAVKLKDLLEAARGGEGDAVATVTRGARYLGEALAPLVNMLNPSDIVIGGSIGSRENFSLYHPVLSSVIRERAMTAAAADCRISYGMVDGASVRGALTMVIEEEVVPFLRSRIHR